ncbi:MAG: TonB-dependent receptor plug domain-containing protein [Bacteroidales bacterium]|jgi:hemoglobin/transferrin/lactoferrin receptor protein
MIKQYKIKASCKALILLGFIMVFNFNDLLSQTVTIISKSTSQPVENCYVYNNDSSKMAISNQKGEFRLDEFSDSDVLTISHVSYYNKRVSVSEIKAKKNKIVLDENLIPLQEFVLIENKRAESLKRTYNKIDIIETKEIRDISPQSSADLLRSSGKVFVQQSQLGGGSPVIRGFESNRLLIVIDGVRMNNAIYRAGHLQNVITIDPEMLERVEVLHGPGSIMYGSDAMGGVMHFFTKNPQLSNSDTTLVNGDLSLRYGSAANDYMQSFRINVGTKKFALLSGVTAKSIGDLRQGSARDEKYGDWGKRLYYVERINNIDSVITNSDPLVQKQSGYKQFDLFTKLLYKPCEKYSVLVNAQYSNTTDVPRYDRLNTFDGNIPKYAEWYYGPQKRALISVKQTLTNNYLLFDEMDVTMAYQNISEDRINRRFRKSKKRHQEETVNQYTFNTDFYKQVAAKNKINYGMEFIYNTVNSNAYHENVKTGEITKTAISRYPDKLNNMFHAAAYLSHKWDICDKFIFSQSLRYNYVTLNSEYTPEMLQLADFPITGVISQKNQTVNGALGVVYLPGRDWRLKANVSTGFRAPNVDDVGKINDSNSDDKLLIIPNPDLKPEQVANAELTVEKTIGHAFNFGVTGFYTKLFDAFVLQNTTINGSDSIMYEGVMSHIQFMSNTQSATLYGFEAFMLANITPSLHFSSFMTYTKGTIDKDESPLDHIPPMFGKTSLKYIHKYITAEVYAVYNFAKPLSEYSVSGEDNPVYATEDGTPAWFTLNAKVDFRISKNLNVLLGVENILDKHYRYFASGISAPGRNIFATLRAKIN